MTDYRTDSGAMVGARTDLGPIASRYATEYGTGEGSVYVGLKAMGRKQVGGSGQVNFLARSWYKTDDMSNSSGRREARGNLIQGQAGSMTTVNVQIGEYGKFELYDDLDEFVMKLRAKGGDAEVERYFTEKSTAHLLESIDYDLLGKLDASSTPWDAADIPAAAMPWDGSTTHIADQIGNVLETYGGPADSVLLTRKAAWLIRRKVPREENTLFQASGSGGILSLEMLSGFFGTYGISNVFIVEDSAAVGNKVNFWQRGTGDAENVPCGIIWCNVPQAGDDAMGIQVVTWDQNPKQHCVLASSQGDIKVIGSLGCRLTGTYTE